MDGHFRREDALLHEKTTSNGTTHVSAVVPDIVGSDSGSVILDLSKTVSPLLGQQKESGNRDPFVQNRVQLLTKSVKIVDFRRFGTFRGSDNSPNDTVLELTHGW